MAMDVGALSLSLQVSDLFLFLKLSGLSLPTYFLIIDFRVTKMWKELQTKVDQLFKT